MGPVITTIRDQMESAIVALLGLDPGPFIAMFADDGVVEFPLDTEASSPTRGKAAIAARMSALNQVRALRPLSATRLFIDEDAQVAFFETAGVLEMKDATLPRLRIVQAVAVEFRNGKAVSWRDYRSTTPLKREENV